MQIRLGAILWLTLATISLQNPSLRATEVEIAGPTQITPPNAFSHYNTTGATIGSYLYLYQQGDGDFANSTCTMGGDKIIAYRALITNGVPGAFERVGRISPCVKSPACVDNPNTPTNECNPWPAASYGPGQIFQATVNGVTKWHLLADVSNTADFHNVWHAESTDGINWTWSISGSLNGSQTESNIQERAGLPGGDVVAHTIVSNWSADPFLKADSFTLLNPILRSFDGSNNSEWWGFFNFGGGVSALRVAWSTGSPVVSVLTSISPWTYTPVANGNMTGLNPYTLYPGANVKTLLLEPVSGQYQLWGSIPASGTYGANVDCNTNTTATCTNPGGCLTGDGSTVANGFTGRPFWWNTGPPGDVTCPSCGANGIAWWAVTRTSFGAANALFSQVRKMPSGYEVARLFPFRWNSPTGNRYLFSATNDNHICNEFLFSSFYKMYVAQTTVANLSDVCTPSSTKLCLQNGRFEVSVDFVNGGVTQAAQTKTYSNQSGFFTFFDPANPEVGVKILDGRAINGKWWVFHGALTSLQYTVRVTDTVAHLLKTFVHPAASGSSLCGGADTGAFFGAFATKDGEVDLGSEGTEEALEFPATAQRGPYTSLTACAPSSTRLCLLGSRFQVEVKRSGVNQGAAQLSDYSGVFWFFDAQTAEVPVKVIDGRGFNGKFWVFFGSLTDQTYQVVVTDTVTGFVKTYNPPGPFCGTADTAAF